MARPGTSTKNTEVPSGPKFWNPPKIPGNTQNGHFLVFRRFFFFSWVFWGVVSPQDNSDCLDLRFRGPGRRSFGARRQKKNLKKVSKRSPGAGPQESEKSFEKGPKSQKKILKMGFWSLFGPFSRLFSGLFGAPGREIFSRLF